MKMESIDFARRYVKLYCNEGDIFTTIRRYNMENVKKYFNKEGYTYTVTIEKKEAFKATLLSYTHMEHLFSVSKYLLMYDSKYYSTERNTETESDISGVISKHKDDPIMLLIFQKVKEEEVK